MTTTTATRTHRTGVTPGAGSTLAGTGTLVRFQLRRDRVRLAAWAAGFALFMLYLAAVLPAAYESEADLATATQLFGDPVGRLLIGPGYGFADPTLERFVANGYGLYFLLLAALMNILLVSRHTRVEEQTGRAELVRANVVGRYATLTATLVNAAVTNLAAAVAVLVMMVGVGGYATGGSVLFSAGIAVTGLAFAALSTITAQLTEYSRAASGMAGAVLGLAFLLRAGGDMAAEGGSALSWVSPLAWGQQTAPFVLDRWWPLALPLGLTGLAAAGGYLLSTRRDVGASFFRARPGRARATGRLGTPTGLAVRMQRAGIIGWGTALVVGGMAFGGYTDALITALSDLPDVFVELFGGTEDMIAGYLAYMAAFMGYLASAYAIMAVQGLRTEETTGRLEPVLATALSRWRWLGAHLAVIAGAVVVILTLTGAATGLSAALVTGDSTHIGQLIAAHLNQVPATLVVLAVATALFGLLPRALPVTWVIVGYGLVVGTFGPLLDLPDVAYDLSPYEHTAAMPLESFAIVPVLALLALAVAAAAAGLYAFRQREINVT